MIIANPIYDTAFRPFMKNERMAKFFIGALLGQTVVSLERSPKEYIYKKITPEEDSKPKRFGYSISFFNFAAIILTETGEQKKILIEVHKTWDKHDLRFYREYVDEHYRKVYEINGEEMFLPIIDVYLLDFNLPEIESACVKIEHGGYRDMTSSLFVENKPGRLIVMLPADLPPGIYMLEVRTTYSQSGTHECLQLKVGRYLKMLTAV